MHRSFLRHGAALVLGTVLLFPGLAQAKTTDDPYLDLQWYLSQIDAEAAWDVTTGSSSVIVAVLDTGVDLDHPDLADNIWTNSGEVAANGKDDDGNGFVDDVYGWDFVRNDNDSNPVQLGDASAATHGTIVASIIGAQGDNAEGIVGVNWDVRIMSVRMLDAFGSGDSLVAAKAIDYAVDNGADIINLSFAGEVVDNTFQEAVERAYQAGVVVVAAMGNGPLDTDVTAIYPACSRDDEADWVIGVAASDEDDAPTSFTNYGQTCTDVSAPGEDMFAAQFPNASQGIPDWYGGGWSGTSMAAPVVSGIAALIRGVYPTLDVDTIRVVIKLSVEPLALSQAQSGKYGVGRVNAAQALTLAAAYAEADTLTEEAQPSTGISPVTGEVEEISTVQAGMYMRSEYFSTVYYLENNEDGNLVRRPFMDTQTFLTWQDGWEAVVTVTDATLPTVPLGGPMLPKAGVVLLKIQSDNKVYALEGSNTLRLLPSESLAILLYGGNWADYVIDVPVTLWPRFVVGAELAEGDEVDTSVMKTRAEVNGT